ncbi:MAG TPA: phosphatase PAP2 family protein [Candidatus Kapabacteria bacterium]|nr:phosphatase PAP2 family protein [Candidatus Kapabacteria bacterium]
MRRYWILCGLCFGLLFSTEAGAQTGMTDSSGTTDSATHHARGPVYHVNYWVSVPIIAAGAAGGFLFIAKPKPGITDADLAALSPNNVPSFDRIALHQNMALVPQWDKYASVGQIIGAVMPLAVLLDPDVRPDWLPVLTIGLEVNMVTLAIYSLSPIGPRFIDRYRPLVYYPASVAAANGINQHDGFGKDGFYSGHVASVAASSFFIGKVYCDYHPDANRYIVYGLASVPPLAMGVIRFMTLDHFPSDIAVGFAVGTLCGVVIPQLHRIGGDGLSMGAYSSPTMGTGLTLAWTPPVMASK